MSTIEEKRKQFSLMLKETFNQAKLKELSTQSSLPTATQTFENKAKYQTIDAGDTAISFSSAKMQQFFRAEETFLETSEDFLHQVHPFCRVFTGEDLVHASENIVSEVARFCLVSSLGEEASGENIEMLDSSNEVAYVAFKIQNVEELPREVRIRRLGNLEGKDSLETRFSLTNEYELKAWYYAGLTKIDPTVCPSTFGFKVGPVDENLEVTRAYSVEDYQGEMFLDCVTRKMKQYRQLETKENSTLVQDRRGSMSAFLWGKKIAETVKCLEKFHSEEIEDCGGLYWRSGKPVGLLDLGSFCALETQKYLNFIEDIRSVWSSYIPPSEIQKVETTLDGVLQSEAFVEACEEKNLRVLPEFLTYKDIRVYNYTSDSNKARQKLNFLSPRHLIKLSEAPDENPIKNEQGIAITNAVPAKCNQYRLAANILWILEFYLNKLDRKVNSLELEIAEYEALLVSLLEGFQINYGKSQNFEGISMLRMEYFLFSLWQTWKTLLGYFEVEERKNQVIRLRDEAIKNRTSDWKAEVHRASREVESLQAEQETWEYELTHSLEHLASIDINYSAHSQDSETIMIHHLRYFKHFGFESWEPNLEHPKFRDITVQKKFPRIPASLSGLVVSELSSIQQRWLNPSRFERTALRPVPEEAYKYDSKPVEATKWVTHQRIKKLTQGAIQLLMQKIGVKFNK